MCVGYGIVDSEEIEGVRRKGKGRGKGGEWKVEGKRVGGDGEWSE